MLKIPNRWFQWLQNVQKPLVGLFRHLVRPKIKEDRLPGSSPSNLLSLDHQNAPLPPQPIPHVPFCVKTQHRAQPHNRANCRTLTRLAPNHQVRGHMATIWPRTYTKQGLSLNHMVMVRVRARRWFQSIHLWLGVGAKPRPGPRPNPQYNSI